MARNTGKAKVDRCNHGKGALFFLPTPLTRHSQLFPTLTGGPDLRTGEYRPKKAKRVLQPIVAQELAALAVHEEHVHVQGGGGMCDAATTTRVVVDGVERVVPVEVVYREQ